VVRQWKGGSVAQLFGAGSGCERRTNPWGAAAVSWGVEWEEVRVECVETELEGQALEQTMAALALGPQGLTADSDPPPVSLGGAQEGPLQTPERRRSSGEPGAQAGRARGSGGAGAVGGGAGRRSAMPAAAEGRGSSGARAMEEEGRGPREGPKLLLPRPWTPGALPGGSRGRWGRGRDEEPLRSPMRHLCWSGIRTA